MDSESISNVIAVLAIFIQILFSFVECLGTLILASIALFGPIWVEKRKRRIFRPIPQLGFYTKAPYFLVSRSSSDINSIEFDMVDKIQVRLGLLNSSKSKILNCEAVIKSYEFFNYKTESWDEIVEFKNKILNWEKSNENSFEVIIDIHPGRERYFDFGSYYIYQSNHSRVQEPPYIINTFPTYPRLVLDKGRHRFHLIFYGDNIDPYEKTVLLSLNGYINAKMTEIKPFVNVEIK